MALSDKFMFGNFSEDEVVDLYTSETKDLEFVWQEQLHVTAPAGQVVGKYPSEGNTLDIPTTYSDKSSHFPGILSPNIPPNPPSTPVEELNNMSREGGKGPATKWNVNATPFIPANVSVITPTKNNNLETTVSSGSRKQLDYHYVSSKLDRLAPRTEQGINHKHLNSTVNHGGGGQTMDKIQTIGLSTTGSSTTSESGGQTTSLERLDIQARTESDDSSSVTESHSGIVISVPNTVPSNSPKTHSSEDAPSIQAQSPPPSSSINGLPTRNDAHVEQSSIQSSLSSLGGLQPSPTHNQTQSEHIQTDASNGSQVTKESTSPHPSHHTSSHTHTVTSPLSSPPHTITSHSNTDVTSSRTISCSTPSGSLSPLSVASTGRTPTPGTTANSYVINPVVSKPKSWASIVVRGSNQTSSPAGQTNSPSTIAGSSSLSGQSATCSGSSSATCTTTRGDEEQSQEQQRQEINPTVSNGILKRLGEKLSQWRLSHVPLCIQPRGLINQGNWCYMHAPLQALLCCPGMYHLCKDLDPYPPLTKDPSPTPITDTMAQFFHEFKPYPKTSQPPPVPAQGPKKKRPSHRPELLYGDPFRPVYVYDMLQKIKSNLSYKGRQEDAEEFLGCVLDRLHMEMVSAKKSLEEDEPTNESSPSAASPSECASEETSGEDKDEEWEQVGPKNKSTITRQTSFSESPITEIFGGELRSAVHRQGVKESATVEPFFSLQLDIQSDEIWTVKDALDVLAVRETVHMSEVEAQRRITLAHLPPVLILHLKRFIFNLTGGSQKLQKPIQYSTDLEISKDLLAPAIKNKLTLPQRSYKLWAVVYHHGKTATGGHYTCDAHHPACGGWVRTDDSLVKLVPEEHVLKPPASLTNKVAYLLFYRRMDTIRT